MLKLESFVKVTVLKMLANPPKEPRMTKFAPVVASLFPEVVSAVKTSYYESSNPEEWTNSAEESLKKMSTVVMEDQIRRDIVQASITYYFLNEKNNMKDLQRWSEEGRLR